MTDNKRLKYLLDQPNLNARKARWLALLSEYDFEIQQIKGKENKVADALSRNATLNFTVAINTYTKDLEEQFKAGIEQDENYLKLQAKAKKNIIQSLSTGYSLNEKGLLMYKDRLYIPNVPNIKLPILNQIYKTSYSGHPSYQKTITMLKMIFFSKHEK